jgi:hypothetical protein
VNFTPGFLPFLSASPENFFVLLDSNFPEQFTMEDITEQGFMLPKRYPEKKRVLIHTRSLLVW